MHISALHPSHPVWTSSGPCIGSIYKKCSAPREQHHLTPLVSPEEVAPVINTDILGGKVFQRGSDDDELALSVEDGISLEIMDREV